MTCRRQEVPCSCFDDGVKFGEDATPPYACVGSCATPGGKGGYSVYKWAYAYTGASAPANTGNGGDGAGGGGGTGIGGNGIVIIRYKAGGK